ncbi:hypothetical protein BD779DRAFT_1471137 [Infundibulicybe gibba]|nr:hypothetical protein BD779DRAFT_1471137 [Infundibulicybe gibba]
MPRISILKIPIELLHLIFTQVSDNIQLKPESYSARLRTLRLLCHAFNNAIMPILFAHIAIDVDGRLESTAIQIEQLSRPHECGSVHRYRVVRTLEIRTLGVAPPPRVRRTRSVQRTNGSHEAIDAGLSTAIAALTGLRDVHWTMCREDSAERVGMVIKGLCALPPDLEFRLRVGYIAGSMDPQLMQLGARLTSLVVARCEMGSVLHTRDSKGLEALAALVANSPRLDQFHFERTLAADDFEDAFLELGLDDIFEPASLDLDALLSALPPDCPFPPHLVLDEVPVHLAGAAHRLHALQTLVMIDPPVEEDARQNDTWNAPLWGALGTAGVFPPHIVASDINAALIAYLARHPGLDTLALHTMHDPERRYLPTDDQDAFAATFFATALPRHAHSLRHLCIEFIDPGGAVYTAPAISQCTKLETLSMHLTWKDQDNFAEALGNVLLLVSVIPTIQRLAFAIGMAEEEMVTERQVLRLMSRVDQNVWDVVTSLVPDEAGNVPKEILVRGHLFCIGTVEGKRRYVGGAKSVMRDL